MWEKVRSQQPANVACHKRARNEALTAISRVPSVGTSSSERCANSQAEAALDQQSVLNKRLTFKFVQLMRTCCYPNNQDWHSRQYMASTISWTAVHGNGLGEEKSVKQQRCLLL